MTNTTITGERADLLAELAARRHFLRFTTRDLTDEQARQRTTTSALTIGGLIKHVTAVERRWTSFIVEGPAVFGTFDAAVAYGQQEAGFRVNDDETLAGLLDAYADTARTTDELVALTDLDASHPLPEAPWFEKGARWTARRVILHILGETAQHSGHADIIRESLDGAKTMA